MCRKECDREAPGSALGEYKSLRSVAPDALLEDNFSLFDDHNEYVIICFYEDKALEWINNNFEEQLEEYMITCAGYSYAGRHRWMTKLLYVFANFVKVGDDKAMSYANFLLPEWNLVCDKFGVSKDSRYDELYPSMAHVDETTSMEDGGEGRPRTQDSTEPG